jgi:hypothetical protein
MQDAENSLGKPVVLEEFGKRLIKGKDAKLFYDAIDRLRNPVFETTYKLVTAAMQSCVLPSISCPGTRLDSQESPAGRLLSMFLDWEVDA